MYTNNKPILHIAFRHKKSKLQTTCITKSNWKNVLSTVLITIGSIIPLKRLSSSRHYCQKNHHPHPRKKRQICHYSLEGASLLVGFLLLPQLPQELAAMYRPFPSLGCTSEEVSHAPSCAIVIVTLSLHSIKSSSLFFYFNPTRILLQNCQQLFWRYVSTSRALAGLHLTLNCSGIFIKIHWS